MNSKPRVAIVYDRVNKFGGAERVLLALRSIYPDSVLFTSVYDKKRATWVGTWDVRVSFLQHIPFARHHHEWFALVMPWAFSSLGLKEFDIVISVTSEFAKNVTTSASQLHVCYCLTPTRYLWSHTKEYGAGIFSFFKHRAFSFLRYIDARSAKRPDAMLAISQVVKRRIKKYYGRDAEAVIYPPTTFPASTTYSGPHNCHYLVVSRLVPYKRIEVAIRACKKMQRKLVIVGSGSDFSRLERIASGSKYIVFMHTVTDQQLSVLYGEARALLCPQEEDFGLVSIEAQLHGTPVISYSQSGVAETLIDAKTGILFTSQTDSSIITAISRFESMTWNSKLIHEHGKIFDRQIFVKRFSQTIEKLWKQKLKTNY